MLSYQHAYHAGNPADVHKHALLAWVLAYLTRKDKPLSYIDTHAGRAVYDLADHAALKTGEAAAGIQKLLSGFKQDHPYARAVAATRDALGPRAYPGSPSISQSLLRPDDMLYLAELHPREYKALQTAMAPHGARCLQQDGLQMALSICPPTPRRGLLLIDPSYEVKAEYKTVPKAIQQLHRKWNVGVIMLWYPILKDGAHQAMINALQTACPEAIRHEVAFPPVKSGHRMMGSGLFVINAPYGFADAATEISSLFQQTLNRPM